ncbi:PAS domain S-box protein [Methylobacterium oryzae]|uniref:histidine kinase n=1 Tax=Methylobacterium oryzae TaxID=334852 RepID=A0ABU7TVA5_9HYPH
MRALATGYVSRRLVLLGAIICSMLVGLGEWHEWDQRAADIRQTETAALNVARAVAREADATFRLSDTVLFGIIERLQNEGRSPGALERLSRSMATATDALDSVGALFVYDAEGNWIASSRTPIPPGANNADRAYFHFHKADPSLAPHLSEPIRSRSSGAWIILVSRRLQSPDGSFAGVVAATVDVQRFIQRLSGFDVGSGGVIALLTGGGRILARQPFSEDQIGRDVSATPLFQADLPSRSSGVGRYVSPIDGNARLAGFATASMFPVVAYAAVSEDEALASWRSGAIMRVAVLGLLLAALSGLGLRLLRDVRRREQAEGELARSEERYRLLAENTSDLIVFKPTMMGRHRYVSPAVRTILGWEPEEYGTLPAAEIIHPDELAEVSAVYAALSPEHPQATHMHRLRHKAGHYVWIESVLKLVGHDPQDSAVLVTGRDVTARRAADEALRVSEARYRLLSEATTDMVTHLDLSSRRLYVSPASRELLGYEPHELIGTSPGGLTHPEDAEGLAALLAEMSSGSREQAVHVYRLRHRDGRWVWVEASLRCLEDEGGQAAGFVASVRNIDARKADEAALLAARAEAERASAAKSEFLASMSHEIRTPLNGVIGYADLLLDEPGIDGRPRQCGERIRSAGAALLTVVNDILDFSKIEAGQVEIAPRPFSLAALIDDTVSIVRGLAEAKGLALHVDLDPASPPWLAGDEDRLRQVLLNLLNNAIKFTPAGGVGLRVAAGGGPDPVLLAFSVTDTGIGIPAAERGRLFKRFSQVDGSYRRRYGGTGLGLAISKLLVELMGGRIGVESEEGTGSTFRFELDLDRAEAPPPVASGSGAGPARRGRHLLLAEDVTLNQELARTILEGAGHTVDIVADGAEAVRAVQARRYDLVLMDVQMPVMDGVGAARRIRALADPVAAVPIIALTANVLPQQVAEFREAGMSHHVGKPFRREELLAAIDRWADDRSHQRPAAVEGGSSPATESTPGVLDAAVLEELSASIGAYRIERMLDLLASELNERFRSDLGDRERVARDAHAIVSAAGSLGFLGLSSLCREIETAARSDADLTPLTRRLAEQRAAALRLIRDLSAA